MHKLGRKYFKSTTYLHIQKTHTKQKKWSIELSEGKKLITEQINGIDTNLKSRAGSAKWRWFDKK